VEDEKKMAALLQQALEEQKCSVQVAHTGPEGLRIARGSPVDVITLDVLLPGMDGFTLAHELRRSQVLSPILFLTARDAKIDVVRGFDAGGDDYLTKPFSFIELLARLRALVRRRPELPAQEVRVADLVLNPASQEVARSGMPIELSKTEYLLLEALMRNSGRVLQRKVLFDAVWGAGHTVENNTLDVYVRLLRRKIDQGHSTRLIKTVRGFGYRMESQPSL